MLSLSPKMIVTGIAESITESKRFCTIAFEPGTYPGELAIAIVASTQSSIEKFRQRGLTLSKPDLRAHSYFKNAGAIAAVLLAKKRSAETPEKTCTKEANQKPAGANATTLLTD